MSTIERLASLLHESGVGCHPTAERGDMRHHDAAAALLIGAGVTLAPALDVAEAVRDALTDFRAAVEGLPTHTRRNGWATPTVWVTRRAVLAEIDKRMPGGAR